MPGGSCGLKLSPGAWAETLGASRGSVVPRHGRSSSRGELEQRGSRKSSQFLELGSKHLMAVEARIWFTEATGRVSGRQSVVPPRTGQNNVSSCTWLVEPGCSPHCSPALRTLRSFLFGTVEYREEGIL